LNIWQILSQVDFVIHRAVLEFVAAGRRG